MSKFVSYVFVLLLGFLIGLGVLYHWYGPPNVVATQNAPNIVRTGIGIDKAGANPVRNAAEVASKYVVNIDTQGRPVQVGGGDFFGVPIGPTREEIPVGKASGVLFSSDGYILTNNHVVEDAAKLQVTLYNGKSYAATLVGRDPKTDLAVIKIDASGLPYAQFGNSDSLQVGDWVIAVGNALGLGPTVTVGVVSAKRKDFGLDGKVFNNLIQTDAAINRGNSGGALSDINGNVVGINTAIISPSGGSIGVGFAIPSKYAEHIADQLVKEGKVRRPWLGIRYVGLAPEVRRSLQEQGVKNLPKEDGAFVIEVVQGSPAAEAGIQQKDVILKINGKPISVENKSERGKTSIADEIARIKIGDRVRLEVWHASNNRISIVSARVTEMPTDIANQP